MDKPTEDCQKDDTPVGPTSNAPIADPTVEIYLRPYVAPALAIDDGKNVRVHYAGQWIDFRNGFIKVTRVEA